VRAVAETHQQLIRDTLRGDTAAVRELVALLTPVIQARVARALLQRRPSGSRSIRQEVEDLSQEVFLALFSERGKALRAWSPERGLSLPNFVGLLAQRQAISILRSGRRSPWRDDPADLPVIDAIPEPGPHQEGRLASAEVLRQLLDRMRESLSPLGLELFHRLLVEQQSVEHICQAMEMKPDAVYAWRSRLGKLARQLLREIEDAPEKAVTPKSDRRRAARIPKVQSDP
jgi:DNA-directed RNA polymerase specialized sigma24 family protein